MVAQATLSLQHPDPASRPLADDLRAPVSYFEADPSTTPRRINQRVRARNSAQLDALAWCAPLGRQRSLVGADEGGLGRISDPRVGWRSRSKSRRHARLSAQRAEGEGFEPSIRLTTDNGFRDRTRHHDLQGVYDELASKFASGQLERPGRAHRSPKRPSGPTYRCAASGERVTAANKWLVSRFEVLDVPAIATGLRPRGPYGSILAPGHRTNAGQIAEASFARRRRRVPAKAPPLVRDVFRHALRKPRPRGPRSFASLAGTAHQA